MSRVRRSPQCEHKLLRCCVPKLSLCLWTAVPLWALPTSCHFLVKSHLLFKTKISFHLWEAFFHKYSEGIDILSSPVHFKHESVNCSSCNPSLRPLYFRSSLRIVTTVLFLRSVHSCEVMDLTLSILRNTKMFCRDLAIAPPKVQLCVCACDLNLWSIVHQESSA